LVDLDGDPFSALHRAAAEMLPENFLGDGHGRYL
jgi:hypothetical protein